MEKTRETYEKELIELKKQLSECNDENKLLIQNQIEDKEQILELLNQRLSFQIQSKKSLLEKLIKIKCNINKDTTILIFVIFTSLFAYVRLAFQLFYGILFCFSFYYFTCAFFHGKKMLLLKKQISLTTILQCIFFGLLFIYSSFNIIQLI